MCGVGVLFLCFPSCVSYSCNLTGQCLVNGGLCFFFSFPLTKDKEWGGVLITFFIFLVQSVNFPSKGRKLLGSLGWALGFGWVCNYYLPRFGSVTL